MYETMNAIHQVGKEDGESRKELDRLLRVVKELRARAKR